MVQGTLEFRARFSSGDQMFDHDIRDLDFCMTTQGLRLYASNGVNGGVATYALSSQGAQLLDLQAHDRGATLRTGQAVVLEHSGVLLQSGAQAGVSQHDIAASGRVADADALRLPGQSAPVTLMAIGHLSQDCDVLVTLDTSGVLSSWRSSDNGVTAASRSQFTHDSGRALAITETGILLVADADLGGLASYRVNSSTGQLTALAQVGTAQGVSIETPTALEVIETYGQSWAVLGAADSDSLTVVSITQNGDMQMVDHLSDTLATRFGGVTALEVVTVAGRVLVLAGGSDGGVSLLELLPDGRLLHKAAFESGVGQDLHGINAIAAVEIEGGLDIYISSQNGAGLAQLHYYVRDLVAAGQQGSASDDLLSGAGRLSGGAGDDILVAAATGAVLTGGAGADIFMATELRNPEQTLVRITDFTVGEDSIDLSTFTALRSLSDLVVRPRGGGLEISYDGHRVVIDSNTGAALSLSDIWPAGLGTPHRWLAGETIDDGITYGGSASDQLSGGSSDDMMDGQGGDDRIDGGGGNDRIEGGDGRDNLIGGDGADSLAGGRGEDLLQGGSGNDRLEGGLGADRLEGGIGNDTLEGGADADRLWGGTGNDDLRGGLGNDQLRGDAGADRLYGGGGADILLGGRGNDRLKSGSGTDTLKGGGGNDLLVAGGGSDILAGGGGSDVLRGGGGSDTLNGGRRDDVLKGGNSADVLIGGTGDDRLIGGRGGDVFVFARRHGADKIRDFDPDSDHIDLQRLRLSYEDLDITREGRSTIIDTGTGEIELTGLRPHMLSVDDFIC